MTAVAVASPTHDARHGACVNCGGRRYKYTPSGLCQRCGKRRPTGADEDPHPDAILRPRRQLRSPALELIAAILETAIDNSQSPNADLRAQGQWWFLDDHRDETQQGSLSWCCALLGLEAPPIVRQLIAQWAKLGKAMAPALRTAAMAHAMRPARDSAIRAARDVSDPAPEVTAAARERTRHAQRVGIARAWANPQWAARQREKLKERWARPGYRERMSVALSAALRKRRESRCAEAQA